MPGVAGAKVRDLCVVRIGRVISIFALQRESCILTVGSRAAHRGIADGSQISSGRCGDLGDDTIGVRLQVRMRGGVLDAKLGIARGILEIFEICGGESVCRTGRETGHANVGTNNTTGILAIGVDTGTTSKRT